MAYAQDKIWNGIIESAANNLMHSFSSNCDCHAAIDYYLIILWILFGFEAFMLLLRSIVANLCIYLSSFLFEWAFVQFTTYLYTTRIIGGEAMWH